MTVRGQIIFLCVLALLTVGVVMVNSAGMNVAPVGDDGQIVPGEQAVTLRSILMSRPAIYAGVAIVGMLACSVIPTGGIDRFAAMPPARAVPILAGVVVGLLALLTAVYLPGVGREMNGSHRWLNLPVAGSLQPSEVAKWLLIPVVACGALLAGPTLNRVRGGLIPLLAAIGLVSMVIVVEDLGTAVLISGVGVLLLIAAGLRVWILAAVAPLAAAALTFAVLSSPYRVDRVVSFIDPFQDAQGDGYHMIQSMATIAGGGPFGRGLGHGLQKFGYLPEDTTDFLFAVICEELGLAGATLVIALYVAMFVSLAGIVRAAASPVRRLIALGVLLTLVGQTIINLFVVTGMGPTKGIALPLLSAGGTGWILTAAALGVVLAIDRATSSRDVTLPETAPTIASA